MELNNQTITGAGPTGGKSQQLSYPCSTPESPARLSYMEPTMSVRPEYSGKRDLTYSAWHRTLNQNCYTMNLDWVEYRCVKDGMKIVALIEDKIDLAGLLTNHPDQTQRKTNVARWREKQMPVFLQVARGLNVPGYLVLHTACQENPKPENWIFSVHNLCNGESEIFSEKEYREFIENLGRANA